MLVSSLMALLGAGACLLGNWSVQAQAVAEPPGDQIYLGAWVDTGLHDSPTLYNQRVGYNFSMFQIAINIPQTPYNYVTGAGGPPPEYTIEQTQTSASVLVTVYPTTFNILEADYATLGEQLKNYTEVYNRTVFLRFAPEMQGIWWVYGNQPTAYLAMWKTMFTYIRQVAPQVLIVWAPNTGQGYPYGQTFNDTLSGVNVNAAADQLALDTNHDGKFTYLDDAYSPYYPGDEYVDWIGLSVYWKSPNDINLPNANDFCAQAWASTDTEIDYVGASDFYAVYCEGKPSKACLFSEAGAAYHVNDTANSSILAVQSQWINSCITNTTFWDAHPRIKAYMHFEFEKVEYDSGVADLRDYRVSNTSSVLQTWQSALSTFSSRVLWATARTAPTTIPSTGRPAYLPGSTQNSTNSSSSSAAAAAAGIVFQTGRALDFSNPTLFGSVSAATKQRVAVISSITLSAVALGAASLFTRGHGVP